MKRFGRLVSATLAIALTWTAPRVSGQHEHAGAPPEKLGKVHFETSCSSDVAPEFDRAIALLHSFWFNQSLTAFEQVAHQDPSCGIAYWGMAMSHWSNPFGGARSPKTLQAGRAVVEKASLAGAKTQRERDYIAAVAELYKDYETVDHRTRIVNYEKAMERVHSSYSEDREAAAFHALALAQSALPSDKTYANQLKSGAILEKLFVEQPDHPGLAHYIIHSYDYPPLANRALDAARRYAKIAPSAPHALHMPSHTFTRVGYWQESIDTNIASAIAAEKDASYGEELHAMDYQAYAYLQMAQDRAVKAILDELPAIARRLNVDALGAAPGFAGLFALAAIPARYTLERHAWAEAVTLQPLKTSFPHTDAITYFARALGFARSGDAASAQKEIAQLEALRDALKQAKDAYWSEQVEIQRRVAAAWAARAEGKKEEALAQLRSAADLEDTTDKSAVTPGPLAPARELLGEMLLEDNQPALALQEFEATMKKEPNRLRGVYGGARAAELAGDRAKARTYYSKLVELCSKADSPDRAELSEARRFLSKS